MVRQTLVLIVVAVVSSAGTTQLPTKPAFPPPQPTNDVVVVVAQKPATFTKPDLETLAKTDPIAMLEECRSRYAAKVRGYKCTMVKRERVEGILYDEEVIRVCVRHEPYAVLMLWQTGSREVKLGSFSLGRIEGVLYTVGENKGDMLAWRPEAKILPTTRINPTSDQAKAASRYSITEGSISHAMERAHKAWSESRERGQLKWDYLGTKPVEKAGNRVCHLVRRTCKEPELDPFIMRDPKPDPKTRPADTFRTITLMIDAETGFQIGSRLERDGELIGEYYFRDLEINPAFGKDQFKQSSLKK